MDCQFLSNSATLSSSAILYAGTNATVSTYQIALLIIILFVIITLVISTLQALDIEITIPLSPALLELVFQLLVQLILLVPLSPSLLQNLKITLFKEMELL